MSQNLLRWITALDRCPNPAQPLNTAAPSGARHYVAALFGIVVVDKRCFFIFYPVVSGNA